MNQDLDWVIGSVIERIESHAPPGWCFFMSGDICLQVDCHWQLVRDGHVTLASGDEGQKYGLPCPVDVPAKATKILSGRKLLAISCDPASADLVLEFEGKVLVRTFNDSSGYEAWQLNGPQGRLVVGTGGGNVYPWEPDTGRPTQIPKTKSP